jgi:uncharacterized protein
VPVEKQVIDKRELKGIYCFRAKILNQLSKIKKMPQLPIFKRDITLTIGQRLHEKPKSIQVILGPRQVGKTTAILQLLAEWDSPHHYAAADLPAPPEASWIIDQWVFARSRCDKKNCSVLVLDEVQKVHR